MSKLIILCTTLLQLWGLGISQNTTEKSSVGSFLQDRNFISTELKEGKATKENIRYVGEGKVWTTEQQRVEDIRRSAKTAASSVAEAIDGTIKRIPVLDNFVFSNCIEPPAECPNSNITFWYYSRSRPENPVQLLVSDPESLNSLPKSQDPWKIIIHGYTKSKDDIPNPQLRSAYFRHGDYNLISVDYEPIARDKCYVQAVHNVPLIANCTAQLIDALMERDYFSSKNLHVIGYSLGAQIAGLIHNYLKHEKPDRVTGLDPAAPLFDGVLNHKLTPQAGEFVDVIHTNALIKGKLETSGHVDFYVNGGLNQPGCLTNNSGSFSTCSHDRSPLYFAESINSVNGFWGIPCEGYLKFYSGLCDTEDANLVLMGEYVPHTARGSYYLETTSQEPFALGKRSKVLAKKTV